MKKLLYIIANPKNEENSYSKSMGNRAIEILKEKGYLITTVDVYKDDIQMLDYDALEALAKRSRGIPYDDMLEQEKLKLDKIMYRISQLKDADEIIFSYPMWNFSIPPMLKAYLDNLVIAGETFNYTPNGPIGLLNDKRVTIIQSSGGVYNNEPMKSLDHGSYYIEQLMGFIGIKNIEHIKLEGLDVFGSVKNVIVDNALERITKLF